MAHDGPDPRYKEAMERYTQLYLAEVDQTDGAKPCQCAQEYLQLSIFFQSLFIREGGYIIDTGNFQTANVEMMPLIVERIQRHPHLWKLFMVG